MEVHAEIVVKTEVSLSYADTTGILHDIQTMIEVLGVTEVEKRYPHLLYLSRSIRGAVDAAHLRAGTPRER